MPGFSRVLLAFVSRLHARFPLLRSYIVGTTNSNNFPVSGNAHDPARAGADLGTNGWNAAVLKFNSSAELLDSTYFGGSSADYGYAVALDSSGNACVTEKTGSTNFSTVINAYSTNAHSELERTAGEAFDGFLITDRSFCPCCADGTIQCRFRPIQQI